MWVQSKMFIRCDWAFNMINTFRLWKQSFYAYPSSSVLISNHLADWPFSQEINANWSIHCFAHCEGFLILWCSFPEPDKPIGSHFQCLHCANFFFFAWAQLYAIYWIGKKKNRHRWVFIFPASPQRDLRVEKWLCLDNVVK